MRKAVLIVTVALALGACSAAEQGVAGGELVQQALLEQLGSASPPLVLDVRTPAEYASGHVPGARNVPHDELASRVGELAAAGDREVVVYCERGPRARRAQAVLGEAGFTRVFHLEGDMSAWREKQLPCDGC